MLKAINLHMLRNGEFIQFSINFAEIIELNGATELNVTTQLAAFKAKTAECDALFKIDQASSFTRQLQLMDEYRDKAITGLTSVINGYCYHYDGMLAEHANLLAGNLVNYGPGISRQNYQAETMTISSMIDDWETNASMLAALTALNLVAWKDDLKNANNMFNDLYLQRTQEYGASNPETLKLKREETMVAYYELRKFLDAYSVIQNTALYQKTINELNALIDLYNQVIADRLQETPETPIPEPVPAPQ